MLKLDNNWESYSSLKFEKDEKVWESKKKLLKTSLQKKLVSKQQSIFESDKNWASYSV